jgi:hypothetical protein
MENHKVLAISQLYAAVFRQGKNFFITPKYSQISREIADFGNVTAQIEVSCDAS